MMQTLNAPFTLVARLLLSAIFISAGLSKITGFEGTVGYIEAYGLPMASMVAALTILLEVVAGIALLVGYQARLAAFLLGGFTLIAAVIFHAFWAVPVDQAYMQQLMFMKNLSIAGGLFMVTAMGSGAWSLDQRRSA